MNNKRTTIVTVLFSIFGTTQAVTAQPDGTAPRGIDEIIVTAQRRAENLQEVPVTVTAVSADKLVASGVNTIQQLSALAPSLSVVDPTGYTQTTVRGIGSTIVGAGVFSSTAIYIDGAYIARLTNAMFEFDNIESVQVLAGPQGALYGRNATAGAIVITSRKPEPGSPFTGNVTAGVGNYSQRDFSGALYGGLGDKWGLSLTVAKHDRDGYVNNLNPSTFTHDDDMDDRDSVSGAVQLVFEPNDRMSFALRTAYSKSEDRSSGGYVAVGQDVPGPFPGLNDNQSGIFLGGIIACQIFYPCGDAAPVIAAEAATSAVFASGFRDTYDNQRSGFQNGMLSGQSQPGSNLVIENILVTLNAGFEFDNFTLRSISGYTDSDFHGSVQVSLERPGSATSATLGALLGAPGPVAIDALGGLGFASLNPSKVYMQSFQLLSSDDARINWIAGVDYSKEKGEVLGTGDTFGISPIVSDNEFEIDSRAVYAQATIPFGDNWSVTLGGRYTDETYDAFDRQGLLPDSGIDSRKFTYTARLQYQADEWLGYGGVTTGYKTGVVNVATYGAGEAEEEEVTTFEVGLKRDFSNRYRLNTALYYSIYKNVQLQVLDQTTGGNILDNGPESEVRGIDLQGVARLTDNFELSLSATFLDTEFTENSVNLPAVKGNTLPNAADFVGSLVADWSFPVATGGLINLTTTAAYNSGKWYDHLNLVGSGGSSDDDFTTVNLNLTYMSADERWTVSLWGNNVFDEKYYRAGLVAFNTFGLAALPGAPATYGGTVRLAF